MADDSKVKEAVEWYSKTRGLYETLAKKVEITVREILKSKGVNYHSITSRPKSISRMHACTPKKGEVSGDVSSLHLKFVLYFSYIIYEAVPFFNLTLDPRA